jgi:hypothetical protein
LATFTFDENIVSDLHKDAYGFRPVGCFWTEWEGANDAGKQVIWDQLVRGVAESIEADNQAEADAIRAFDAEVALYIENGALNRETAIRWMSQGEKFYDIQDVEQWLWERGVLFTPLAEEVKPLLLAA